MKTFYFYNKKGSLVYSENKPKGKYFSIEAENSDQACFYYQLACGF